MIKIKPFVYYDERYPTNWVSDNVAKQMVKFLEEKGFEVVDATDLKKVMADYTTTKVHNEEVVIVFSRDIVPDVVLDNPTNPTVNSLIRRYLNAGHSIVWLGDIPLYYVGYNNGEKRNLPPNACQTVLGLNSNVLQVSYKVRLTFYGLMYDLPAWIGKRPHVGVIAGVDFIPLAISWHSNRRVYHGFIASYVRQLSGFIRIYDFEMQKPLGPEYLEAIYTITIMRNPIIYLMREVRKLNERLETKFNTIKHEVDSLVEHIKKICS